MMIDIHTHHPKENPSTNELCFVVGIHSLGIHPWELEASQTLDQAEEKFRHLQKRLQKNVFAVGECGLDRAREGLATIEVQLKVLEWHMDWAIKTKRPLILHCVRAHSDLLMLLKKKRYDGKILLHDYAGNLIEAMKFLDYDAYFSFGSSFFRKNSKTPQVFRELPSDRIFLETDDQTELSLASLYEKASAIRKMKQDELEKLIYQNLLTFFGDLNDISPSDLVADLS